MIPRIRILLLVLLAAVMPAADVTYDITGYPHISIGGGVTLTTAQISVQLNNASPGPTARLVQITCDVPWSISDVSGAYGTKQPLTADQSYVFMMGDSTKTFYFQAASTSGTLRVSVLGTPSH